MVVVIGGWRGNFAAFKTTTAATYDQFAFIATLFIVMMAR